MARCGSWRTPLAGWGCESARGLDADRLVDALISKVGVVSNFYADSQSCGRIPGAAPGSVPVEMSCFDQGPEVPLEGITAGPGDQNRVGNAHAAPVTGDFQYSSREYREVAE